MSFRITTYIVQESGRKHPYVAAEGVARLKEHLSDHAAEELLGYLMAVSAPYADSVQQTARTIWGTSLCEVEPRKGDTWRLRITHLAI